MVSFARARTRSLLSKLWPVTEKSLNNHSVELREDDIEKQNKCFLEASKNGGMWFS
ncbi:hypothetical protein [Prochlorococcus sp. MIT 1011]|uniref:hypothetical protein n=1 Tax=Prochlorococcus sp. MIT 1011 TaxID=3082520 RepID=UPI0039B4F0F8